jgi:hypothetical protein
MPDVKVPLSRPLTVHGPQGTIRELVIRELTAGVMMRNAKLPFKPVAVGENMGIEIDYSIAGKWLADMTGHDEAILSALTPLDFGKAIKVMSEMIFASGVDPKA